MKAVKERDELQKIVDKWQNSAKSLFRLIDSSMSSTSKIGLGYGIHSNNEVLSYEEKMNHSVFHGTPEDYIGKPLYSRFIKTNDYKGVPHPLNGDYTPMEQPDIDDSLYVPGKRGPQLPDANVSDKTSEYSTYQSHDSDRASGISSASSEEDEPISPTMPKVQPTQMPKPTQQTAPSFAKHVKAPRQPTSSPEPPKVVKPHWNQRMDGNSVEQRKCFVCRSLSHLIKDCDYYEKKMAKEAEFTRQRMATPVWTNVNRINHANQFAPRSNMFNSDRKNFNSGRPHVNSVNSNINTVRPNFNYGNVNSGKPTFKSAQPNVNTVRPTVSSGSVNTGIPNIKSVRPNVNTGKHTVNSGSFNFNSARPQRPVSTHTSNRFCSKRPQVNHYQRRSFSNLNSPVKRPFQRKTAQKFYSNAVHGNWGTAAKTSAGYDWRTSRPHSNYNSGPTKNKTDHPLKNMMDRGIFDSGCSGHMTGNKDQLEDFEEFHGGSVTFGGSKGYIEIRHHFIRDSYDKKLIQVEKIHTGLNVADLLTKPFDGPRYEDDWKLSSAYKSKLLKSGGETRLILASGVYSGFSTRFKPQIKATIDSKVYTISEASIRTQLQLEDALGIHMLPNDDIIVGMRRLGYPSNGSFTFWKGTFTPPWRFLVHHILHCLSSKSGGWDQFGSNIAVALICLSTGQVFNFSKLIFDGMLSNMKSRTKFLMYPRFLQMILDVETENKHPYLAVFMTKKIFANMRRGFQGVPRPLFPAMLVAEQEAEGAEQEIQGEAQAEPKPEPEPDMKHSYSTPSPHQSPQPSHATGSLSVEDLFQLVASQKPGPKGIKRYIRRKVLPGKIKFDEVSTDFEVSIGIDTGVNTGEVNTCGQDVNTGSINVSTACAPVNTGSINVSTASVLVSTGIESVSTDSTRVSTLSPPRSRREGKAPMTAEDEPAPKKTKV
ncbi:hypothetical protein Tco_0915994 [Tanacetum coccineum]